MMKLHRDTRYPFDRADVYEIHVVGKVDESVFEVLGGMTQVRHEKIDEADMTATDLDVTVLTGWLPDQAALNGVLNTLYERHYTLTLVRRLPRMAEGHAHETT